MQNIQFAILFSNSESIVTDININLILASSSPRRRQLLRQIGLEFVVIPPHVDETQHNGEQPLDYVQRLSLEKARAVANEQSTGLVLGSDTIVVLDGQILGKPADEEEAVATLRKLSGNTHTVFTGFSIVNAETGESHTDYGQANVTFRNLNDDEIRAYVAGGSPMDKAGAYGIQEDLGAVFINHIDGDYYTIVGLPLTKVYLALRSFAQRT